jgi:GNAT superfamily N-acetyltransferase
LNFSLLQADKDLFAVYQTIYSNADIEMWYDWNRRLGDTKWTDQCYFLLLDGQKVGGVIITDDVIMFPFLIPPFCDRVMFWNFILKHFGRDKINGVLEEDTSILPMFGYKVSNMSQVMCRPTDALTYNLSDGFICRPLDINTKSEEIGKVIIESYEGGICNEINGSATVESAVEDTKNVLKVYSSQNLSHLIVEKATEKIVAVCLAGIGENYTHGYAEIADLCVLPQFRGIGLAKYMICRSVTDSYGLAPFIKLFVYIGNNAEYLYNQMGFISGPRFTNMTKRRR